MLVCMSRTKLAFTGHVHNVEFESYLVVMEYRSINIPSIDCNGKYESGQICLTTPMASDPLRTLLGTDMALGAFNVTRILKSTHVINITIRNKNYEMHYVM